MSHSFFLSSLARADLLCFLVCARRQKRSWWEVSKLASSNGRARLDFPSFAENGKEGEDVVELGVEIED